MKLSIIIPVYREEKNIKITLERIQKSVKTPHEILLIYHYKTDPTVKVIQTYMRSNKRQVIRLLQNANKSNNRVMKSIKMGFANAKGDAIVVLMADLSDDISQIDSMYGLFKKGFDVICASRYMKGGQKIGGPIVKTFLSRLAGQTLYYFFHVPTHDATNAFKLYNRKIFSTITIESVGGFEYSMEIILKAHSLGYTITEIPTIWRDRMEGSSNFKILSWIPEYCKWYVRAFGLLLVRQTGFNWKFILLLFLLSLASFWRIFSFYFFQDDYQFMWYGLYHPFFFITFRHPGTPLEAIFLAPFFGFHSWLWEYFGLAVKVVVAYLTGLFIYKLTQSKIAGILSSIFFTVSYAGMYAINAFNYHIAALVAIPILLSLVYFVKSMNGRKKDIWKFVVFLLIAFFLDPARVLPIFIIIPFLLLFFSTSKNYEYVKQFLKKLLLVLIVVGIPFFLFWYGIVSKGAGTQFEVFVRGMLTNPRYMITKTKDIGNYLATMTNLFSDIMYGLQLIAPKYETAIYTRIFGITGVGIFIGAIASFIYFLKKEKKEFGLISFFIFWAYIFYLPNWLAEPRAPMSSINHYLFISSIGSIGLIAYLFSFIKKTWLRMLLSAIFIGLTIYKANVLLIQQYPYRSAVLIEKTWQTILSSVPKSESGDLFFFTGDTYWAGYSFMSFGSYNYLLLRKNPRRDAMPLLTTDEHYALSQICGNPAIPLSHVYTWKVLSPGLLLEDTMQQRERLKNEAHILKCNILP